MDVKISWFDMLRSLCKDTGIDFQTRQYLLRRLSKEGLPFLTKTLPELAKSVLRSIELGYFDRPTTFAWQSRTLRFFRFALDRLFDPKTGRLLDQPDALALWQIRQMCEYVYKLSTSSTQEEEERHAQDYKAFQENLKATERSLDESWLETLRKNAETYYPELFKAHEQDILKWGPRFGPGAFLGSERTTADLRVPWWVYKRLPGNLIGTHLREFQSQSGLFKDHHLQKRRNMLPVDSPDTCQLVFVPKDSRGPRKIAKYPLFKIQASMAFFAWASETLERITRNRVNFKDQTINQRLAREGSLTGNYATGDMKDASERITHRVLRHVFRYAPGILALYRKTRSSQVILPNGEKVDLATSTTMGHGMTFPVLAFLGHLSACTKISKVHGIPFKSVMKQVYFYGDDYIVPTEWFGAASEGLELTGFLVNREKSYCRRGNSFRESCGGDYFLGNDVAPVRLKLTNAELPHTSEIKFGCSINRRKRPSGINQLVKHCEELRRNGLISTASYFENLLEQAGLPMPWVGDTSKVLGRWTWDKTLIRGQKPTKLVIYGSGHKEPRYSACLAEPVTVTYSGVCHDKAFARATKPSLNNSHWKWLFEDERYKPFEVIDKPRDVRLRVAHDLPIIALV